MPTLAAEELIENQLVHIESLAVAELHRRGYHDDAQLDTIARDPMARWPALVLLLMRRNPTS